jgi:hypothetical protein
MKGSELLGDMISILVMIGISFVAGGVVLWVMNITEQTDWGSTYSLILNPMHQPIKYEEMILSYLETTHTTSASGPAISTKRIILEAVDQGNPRSVIVDGQKFDLFSITQPTFDSWFQGAPYLFMLKIKGVEYPLGGSSTKFVGKEEKKISVRSLKIPVNTAKGSGELIMYVK